MNTRTVLFILITLCMVMAACTQGQQQEPTMTELPEITPEPSNTPVPTITSTPIPPTLTATPTATPFPPFRDDFVQLLVDGWTWLKETQFSWNLHEAEGFLRMEVNPGEQQILLRDAPDGDFVISTRLLFTPFSNFQHAGLIIFQDENHYITFRRGMCFMPGAEEGCQGNALYFNLYDHLQGAPETGYSIGSQYPTQTENISEAYLRITREWKTYTAYYSADGETWQMIGRHESDIVPLFVGIHTGGAQEYAADADFDYFTLEVLP